MVKVMVTGGTGSFGKTIVRSLASQDSVEDILVFSRDELKQDEMRKEISSSKLRFQIGDVRDFDSVKYASKNMDSMFCAAALKQVPSCEKFPLEAVKTNVLGTQNSISAAIENGLSNVVVLSTDKAVYPINAMGISKAMMEKVALSQSGISDTKINVTRYGNVMGSRGSVIPFFLQKILADEALPVTDINMTRFMMTLAESVDLVLKALSSKCSGEIFVRKSPAADMKTLIDALGIISEKNIPIDRVGVRPGEKMHETLVSVEEMQRAREEEKYFIIEQMTQGAEINKANQPAHVNHKADYTSNNTNAITAAELADKIKNAVIGIGEPND